MRPADDFHDLGDGLFFWEAYDPASKVDLSASALATAGGLFFIDPIALRKEAMEELLNAAGVAPKGIFLTNGNHARAAETFRRRFSIPILAAASAADLELMPDETLADGQTHEDSGFQVIALPGAAPGEAALFHPAAGGVVFVGDAIINLPSLPFVLLPDKYCIDPKELRLSLAKLLQFSFSKMLFAHGPVERYTAKERLEKLLNR